MPAKTKRPGSLQSQLLAGTGLILFLAFAMAVSGYWGLYRLQTRVQVALNEVGRIRELGLQVENEFLSARQNESNFLSSWRSLGFEVAAEQFVTANRDHLERARAYLDTLEDLVATSHDPQLQALTDEIGNLRSLLVDYETGFQTTVGQIRERSRPRGLEDTLTSELNRLEADVTPLANPEFRQLILQIRANEQAYFSTGRQEYVDNVHRLVSRFTDLVKTSPRSELVAGDTHLGVLDLVGRAQSYLGLFSRLVTLDQDIHLSTTTFQEITGDIGRIAAEIVSTSEAGLSRARNQLQLAVRQATMIMILSGVVALALGVLTTTALTRRIVPPLRRLTQAAEEIGRGNLERSVSPGGAAELVTLAQAFNAMAGRLRQTLGTLEQQVAERTRGLQTAAEVARATTSVLDPDVLLPQVVELVQERFNLYYVGLFLLDEERRFAVLRAGTGEAGRQMLAQKHKLEVGGESMIGQCIANSRARIALDVGEEPHRFDNPLLPQTRSELALPLRSRGRVIGAMTVQSDRPAAFDEADIAVMQTMADQVAVALDNARLFAETQTTLAELEAVQRRYLGQAWTAYTAVRAVSGYEQSESGLVPLGGEVLPEAHRAVAQGRALLLSGDGEAGAGGEASPSVLVAPILLRDRPLGAIGFRKVEGGQPWGSEEVALVETIAEQFALAADNLRLLDETQRRAARDRYVSEITSRLGELLDVDRVLQTAVREIGEALGLHDLIIQLETDT